MPLARCTGALAGLAAGACCAWRAGFAAVGQLPGMTGCRVYGKSGFALWQAIQLAGARGSISGSAFRAVGG